MYLPTLDHNSRMKEFSELNFEYFSESGPPIKLNSQYEGQKHMVDFANRFLDPQWVYGQTLLGFYQSVNDFEKITVTLSL